MYEVGFAGMKDTFLNCIQNFYWNKEITNVNVPQIIGLDVFKKIIKKNPLSPRPHPPPPPKKREKFIFKKDDLFMICDSFQSKQ